MSPAAPPAGERQQRVKDRRGSAAVLGLRYHRAGAGSGELGRVEALVFSVDHDQRAARRHRKGRSPPRLGEQRVPGHQRAELLGTVIRRDPAGERAQAHPVAASQDHHPLPAHRSPPLGAAGTSPSCWSRLDTRAVHPARWLAPNPAPSAPGKTKEMTRARLSGDPNRDGATSIGVCANGTRAPELTASPSARTLQDELGLRRRCCDSHDVLLQ